MLKGEFKMAEEKKDFASLEEVKEEEAKIVAGGYAGSDRYTLEEYSKAGVTWEHNYFSKDRYFIKGVEINQRQAEKITEKYFQLGRQLTVDELRVLDVNI
jgi:adenine deaminase